MKDGKLNLHVRCFILVALFLVCLVGIIQAQTGNIDPTDKWAWGTNVGWVNFDPNVPGDTNDYGVKIDSEGNFFGWAWGENVGWINFGLTDYYVIACKVRFEDLANFAEDWLDSGSVPGNLNGTHPA